MFMKKLLFLAAMLLMVGGASAQKKADSKTVYIIDGRDPIKYKKAVELSNQYNLPLIVLKK